MSALPTFRACLLVALATALSSAPARASEPVSPAKGVELSFHDTSGEPSCPTEREFRDRVVARMGVDPFVATARQRVIVTLEPSGRDVRGEVRHESSETNGGKRRALQVRRRECGELGEALAVAVTLMLDPLGTSSRQSTQAEPMPPIAPVPSAPALAASREFLGGESRSQATPNEAPSAHLEMSFGVGPQVSALRGPSVTLGGRVGALMQRGAWALGAEGSIESTPGYVSLAVGQARTLFASGGLLACRRQPWLLLCALGSFGVAQSEMTGVEQSAALATLAGWTGVRAGVPLHVSSSLWVEPTLDVLATLVRTRIRIDEQDAWTAPVIALAMGIDVRVSP